MAVFGNSTSQKHSILAGYQRRANQMKARSTSRFNTANLGNVRDSINDGYNKLLTNPYGDSADLQKKVKTWHDYSVNEVKNANDRLAQATNRLGKLEAIRVFLDNGHADVTTLLENIRRGDSDNLTEYGEKVQEIRNHDPLLQLYEVTNYDKVRRYITDTIGIKVGEGTNTRWVTEAQGEWEWKKGTVRADKREAQELVKEVSKVQDSVHLKNVEDFMVDGRLMRESKTALVVTPITTILVGGLIAYGVYKLGSGNAIGFSGSNKSAAMAVFK